MKFPGVAWRAMTGYDLPAVEQIAGAVHPGLLRSPEVLAERQRLYLHGAYLLEVNERPAGYVLSHPWRSGTLPALNTLLGELPAEPPTPTTSTIWRCCRSPAASAPRASSPKPSPSTPAPTAFPP